MKKISIYVMLLGFALVFGACNKPTDDPVKNAETMAKLYESWQEDEVKASLEQGELSIKYAQYYADNKLSKEWKKLNKKVSKSNWYKKTKYRKDLKAIRKEITKLEKKLAKKASKKDRDDDDD